MYVWIVWIQQHKEAPRLSAVFSSEEEAVKYLNGFNIQPYLATVKRERLYNAADEV